MTNRTINILPTDSRPVATKKRPTGDVTIAIAIMAHATRDNRGAIALSGSDFS